MIKQEVDFSLIDDISFNGVDIIDWVIDGTQVWRKEGGKAYYLGQHILIDEKFKKIIKIEGSIITIEDVLNKIDLSTFDGTSITTYNTSSTFLITATKTFSGAISNTFFINSSDKAFGVGENEFGQLSDTTNDDAKFFRQSSSSFNFDVISAGRDHVIARKKSSNEIYGAGSNFYGQLGGTAQNTITSLVKLHDVNFEFTDVSAGKYSSYFLSVDKKLYCLGLNDSGQLGLGHESNRSVLTEIVSDEEIFFVASSSLSRHCFFITKSKKLYGFGLNDEYQLGLNNSDNQNTPQLISEDVIFAAAGQDHSLFIKSDGSLWGMGLNSSLEILNSNDTYIKKPTEIQFSNIPFTVTDCACGIGYSLFITSDQILRGMGKNDLGQLGKVNNYQIDEPIDITQGCVSCKSGGSHSLILKNGGSFFGMGDNREAQNFDGLTMGDEYIGVVQSPSRIYDSNISTFAISPPDWPDSSPSPVAPLNPNPAPTDIVWKITIPFGGPGFTPLQNSTYLLATAVNMVYTPIVYDASVDGYIIPSTMDIGQGNMQPSDLVIIDSQTMQPAPIFSQIIYQNQNIPLPMWFNISFITLDPNHMALNPNDQNLIDVINIINQPGEHDISFI